MHNAWLFTQLYQYIMNTQSISHIGFILCRLSSIYANLLMISFEEIQLRLKVSICNYSDYNRNRSLHYFHHFIVSYRIFSLKVLVTWWPGLVNCRTKDTCHSKKWPYENFCLELDTDVITVFYMCEIQYFIPKCISS